MFILAPVVKEENRRQRARLHGCNSPFHTSLFLWRHFSCADPFLFRDGWQSARACVSACVCTHTRGIPGTSQVSIFWRVPVARPGLHLRCWPPPPPRYFQFGDIRARSLAVALRGAKRLSSSIRPRFSFTGEPPLSRQKLFHEMHVVDVQSFIRLCLACLSAILLRGVSGPFETNRSIRRRLSPSDCAPEHAVRPGRSLTGKRKVE